MCGRKKLPFAGYSVVKEQLPVKLPRLTSFAREPDLSTQRRALARRRRELLSTLRERWERRRPPNLPILSIHLARCKRDRSFLLLARLSRTRSDGHPPRADHERRLVENTGLEPVTSWLQTRRSPS